MIEYFYDLEGYFFKFMLAVKVIGILYLTVYVYIGNAILTNNTKIRNCSVLNMLPS
jgi:hypothetical protein